MGKKYYRVLVLLSISVLNTLFHNYRKMFLKQFYNKTACLFVSELTCTLIKNYFESDVRNIYPVGVDRSLKKDKFTVTNFHPVRKKISVKN